MSKVALLTGGTSSEREIALQSSKFVAEQLNENFEVEIFDLPCAEGNFLSKKDEFLSAVPVFHGKYGEDGEVQAWLENNKVKYLFSDSATSKVAMNKVESLAAAEKISLNISKHQVLKAGDRLELNLPVFIKPVVGGSSIGTSYVDDQAELAKALAEAFKECDEVLAEKALKGDEYTVVVIESNDKTQALPVIQIISKNEFFDLESKYDASLADEIFPSLNPDLEQDLKSAAIDIHRHLGCRHLSRSDFIVQEGVVYYLETNTIPGMTKNSLMPKAIRQAGLKFSDLLKEWIDLEK